MLSGTRSLLPHLRFIVRTNTKRRVFFCNSFYRNLMNVVTVQVCFMFVNIQASDVTVAEGVRKLR